MSEASERRRAAMEFVPSPSEAPFEAAEYADRRGRFRAAMEAAQIDLLYLTSPEAIHYLTGYQAIWFQALGLDGWEPISGVALHLASDELIHIECDREQALTHLTTLAHDLRVWPLGEGDFLDFILGELEAAGWLGGRTGLERSHYRPYPAAADRLRAGLERKGSTTLDASALVSAVRRLKSPAERACVRQAAAICDLGMGAAIGAARPGVTELELYGEAMQAMARAGGETPSITLPVQSGHRSIAAHAPPSRKRIAPGEVVNLDICGVYNRYHADNARTLFMGAPPADIARLVETSAQAFAIIKANARPGLSFNELMRPLEAHYREAGIWGSQRWAGGYELGVAFPPDWVGAFAYSVGQDAGAAALEPGLVVNYESNFYLPGRPGMSMLIDTLMVDEASADFIHKIGHDLIVIE